jgi:short-subunit dehydrogenase
VSARGRRSSRGFNDRYGPWALVAGASEGLGAEFARQLAARGLALVLVSRRTAPLEAIADELRRAHGVEVRTEALDLGALARPDTLARLRALVAEREIGLAIYNAAHGPIGLFLDLALEDQLLAVDVNCRGPVVLAHECGRAMAARGRGGIVLMSSLSASQGSPVVATYAATKAFNLVLAEGLWEELGARGVDVIACRAGAVRTPAYERSRPAGNPPLMDPAPVVTATLAALGRGPSVVPGWANRAVSLVMGHLLPRRTAVSIIAGATRRMYRLPRRS